MLIPCAGVIVNVKDSLEYAMSYFSDKLPDVVGLFLMSVDSRSSSDGPVLNKIVKIK